MSRIVKGLALGLILASGFGGAASAQVSRYDGQYVGQMTLTGVVGGDCTQPPSGAAYPLSVSAGQVRFKYVPRFDTTLTGQVDKNGNVKAGAHTKHGLVTMTGKIDDNHHLSASIVSPSCNYKFQTGN